MRNLVAIMIGLAVTLSSGCNSGNLKTVAPPNHQEEARQIQNDANLSPEMKARLLHQDQIGSKQPGVR